LGLDDRRVENGVHARPRTEMALSPGGGSPARVGSAQYAWVELRCEDWRCAGRCLGIPGPVVSTPSAPHPRMILPMRSEIPEQRYLPLRNRIAKIRTHGAGAMPPWHLPRPDNSNWLSDLAPARRNCRGRMRPPRRAWGPTSHSRQRQPPGPPQPGAPRDRMFHI